MSLLSLVEQPARHDPRVIALQRFNSYLGDLRLTWLTFIITEIPASLSIIGANLECLNASRLYLENEANMATAGTCPSVDGLEGRGSF